MKNKFFFIAFIFSMFYYLGNSQTLENISKFEKASTITWTGNVDGNWDKPLNWLPNTIPTSVDNVIIPKTVNYPNISTSATLFCNNLTIKPGGRLTVDKLKELNVSANIVIESSSNSIETGSFIVQGTLTVTGKIMVYRYYDTNLKWEYISAPLKNCYSDLFTGSSGVGVFNANFMKYNEAYDLVPDPTSATASGKYLQWTETDLYKAWEYNHNGATGLPGLIENGKGYAFYGESTVVIKYTANQSDINLSSVAIPLSYQNNDANGGYYDGWNLIGNPFTSAYKFVDRSVASASIEKTIYIWDNTINNYIYYNFNLPAESTFQFDINGFVINGNPLATNIDNMTVPIGQAFFVKAKSVGTYTFQKTKQTHSTVPIKSDIKENSIPTTFPYLKFKIESNGKSDETLIRFFENTAKEEDNYDNSYKLYSPDLEVPQLFSYNFNEIDPLAINTLSLVENEPVIIPLAIRTANPGTYKLELINDNLTGVKAYLEDTYLNVMIDLSVDKSYNFDYAGGLSEDRFKTHVTKLPSLLENIDSNFKIYPNPAKNVLYISTDLIENINQIKLIDISGKIMMQQTTKKSTSNIIKLDVNNINSGIYFLTIETNTNVITKKIILSK